MAAGDARLRARARARRGVGGRDPGGGRGGDRRSVPRRSLRRGRARREARAIGSPPEPLVRALREHVGRDAADWVHYGATSQDVMDTAAMLVARSALAPSLASSTAPRGLRRSRARRTGRRRRPLGRSCSRRFRPRSAQGRRLARLARRRPAAARRDAATRLAVQFGGAAGTLAPLGDRGLEVLRLLAQELDLVEPVVPWHASRVRIIELGAALDVAAGVLAKIGIDVALSDAERGRGGARAAR